MGEINTEPNKHLNVVLLGKTRAGKSASGNTILGQEAPSFITKKSSRSVTRDVAVESGTVGGITVTVYDTPGLFNTHMREDEIQQMIKDKVLQRCESGPCVFLLVIKADRFTEEERKTVEKIEELLGEERLKKTWILFTRGDELEEENMTIKEFLEETDPLKNLVQKYDQRYHVFNNKKKGPSDQARLLVNIIQRSLRLKATPASLSSRRIVLLGRSGVGKSASGNTILGQREFRSVMRMRSVTRECSAAHGTVSGRSVSVVDTPGLYHTEMKTEELMTEIARSVYISSPGPHAFLIVFPVNMWNTEYDEQIPQQIEMMFGQEVLKYSIILFTRGDQLRGESVEKLIQEKSRVRDVVDQCGGRFHVFNNKDLNNRDQVDDLLKKIDSMVEENGGGHYRNQMYEDSQRREEKKHQEKKLRQEEIERAIKYTEERIRAEFEGPPRFLQERLKIMRLRVEEKKFDRERRPNRALSTPHFIRMEMVRKQAEEQRREEIERVIKDTEMRIRAEFEGPPRVLLERFKLLRLREEAEKTHREEIERVRKETEERVRADFDGTQRLLQERLKAMRLREEEEKTQREEKQRREEIERVKKETEERVRAEFDGTQRLLQERLKTLRLSMEDRIQKHEELERRMSEEEEMRRIENMRKQMEEMREMGMVYINFRHMGMGVFQMIRCMDMRHRMQRELQEEIDRVIKEIEENIRAEFKCPPR